MKWEETKKKERKESFITMQPIHPEPSSHTEAPGKTIPAIAITLFF